MIISSAKKGIVAILIISFVMAPIYFSGASEARAFVGILQQTVPVTNPVNDLKESGVSVFGVTLPISLDGLAFMAANVVIAQITDSIVNWINSGFQGSPAFIQDPGGWLLETADRVTGAFIEDLGLEDFLCRPFAPIRFSLIYNYNRSFKRDYRCKLSDVINNVENFADFTNNTGGFSRQGGWNTWFDVTQNPSNNPYGVYIGAQLELDRRIADAVGLEQDKLNWGKGFLSIQRCKVWDTADGKEPGPDNPVSGTLPHECKEYGPIETPGSIVEGQLNNALDSELRRISVADEINEILSALVNQLVVQAFSAGVSNLKSGNIITDLEVSCGYTSTSEKVFLNPPTSPNSAPVSWKANVVGGGGDTTYSWSLTGEPQAVIPPLPLTNSSLAPVTYSTPGEKTAKITVTKKLDGRTVEKSASCSLNVLPNPPLEVTSCSVAPSSIPRKKEVKATWTLLAKGGASTPEPTMPDKMGFCIFTGFGDRSPGIGFGYSVPLKGSTTGSSCSFEHAGDFFDDLGPHFMTVFVNSGTQSTSEQCGPLIITNP